jgi:septal ring factor EnvC (AmiA/AmiB activator)
MSEITAIVTTLENRLNSLVARLQAVELKNNELITALTQSKARETELETRIKELTNTLEAQKMANSLLGSDENKRDTKLKINSLIREIDYCIAQLEE